MHPKDFRGHERHKGEEYESGSHYLKKDSLL